MPFNIPIALTWFRLFLLPVFVLVFYLPYSWAPFMAAFVFWLAAITDALDGYAARKLEQSTRFGAFLDPVADKLMVTTALVLLVEDYNTIWLTLPALGAVLVTLAGQGMRRQLLAGTLSDRLRGLGQGLL